MNKSHAVTLKKGPALEIRGDDKKIDLSFSNDNEEVRHKKRPFIGRWEYRANCHLTGSKKGQWWWQWKFTGYYRPKGKPSSSLELIVDKNGKEKVTIKQQ